MPADLLATYNASRTPDASRRLRAYAARVAQQAILARLGPQPVTYGRAGAVFIAGWELWRVVYRKYRYTEIHRVETQTLHLCLGTDGQLWFGQLSMREQGAYSAPDDQTFARPATDDDLAQPDQQWSEFPSGGSGSGSGSDRPRYVTTGKDYKRTGLEPDGSNPRERHWGTTAWRKLSKLMREAGGVPEWPQTDRSVRRPNRPSGG